jgi:hypothetical protein
LYRTCAWGLVAAAALLWPSRAIGPLDGVPLDARLEAIAIGVIVPVLCSLHPRFLLTRLAHGFAVALIVVKLIAMLALAQEGWCARFVMPSPLSAGGNLTQLSWDARADWRHAVPRCSAVVARPYPEFAAFPAWFLNLGGPADRPPRAVVAMALDGYVRAPSDGVLAFGFAANQRASGTIDERPFEGTTVSLTSGVHRLRVSTVIAGDGWRFVPTWNGAGLFSSVLTTTSDPDGTRRWMYRVVAGAIALLVLAILAAWTFGAIRVLDPPPVALAWVAGMSVLASVAGAMNFYREGRLAVVPLMAAGFIRLPPRLRTARAALLLVGIPWLALVAGATVPAVGRVTLFSPGDDFSFFQRFAYRIYMQGYWLEGGQWAFWNQPLYRWVIGLLHIVFGDSSVGDWYLDAASLLVGALFAFVVCAYAASFGWGLFAAGLTLATVAIGPSGWVIGRDLSEITAAGFAYAAALIVLETSRRGSRDRWPALVGAGVLAVLCFYTRLNHLIWMVMSVVLFLPFDVHAGHLWKPRVWWSAALVRRAAIVLAVLGVGVLLFAWRTWYYTGVFSVLFGTQRDLVATVLPSDTFTQAIVHMIQSVLMQVTVRDPPGFDPRSLPIMIGVAVALLALMRVPGCRDVPAGVALFALTALAGALVARGTAYIGRFSIHLMPVTVAIAVCFAARLFRRDVPAPAVTRP